jgi:hypothetical protein
LNFESKQFFFSFISFNFENEQQIKLLIILKLFFRTEENPTLYIYESVPQLFFQTSKSKKDIISNPSIESYFENITISTKFQIFITCTESRFLSSALRSRCFCIHINHVQQETALRELSEIVLSQSSTSSLYSHSLSPLLTHIFSKINEDRQGQSFLFSKDTFSPHRIINCAKAIGNDNISPTSISNGIEMSFVSCFNDEAF